MEMSRLKIFLIVMILAMYTIAMYMYMRIMDIARFFFICTALLSLFIEINIMILILYM